MTRAGHDHVIVPFVGDYQRLLAGLARKNWRATLACNILACKNAITCCGSGSESGSNVALSLPNIFQEEGLGPFLS